MTNTQKQCLLTYLGYDTGGVDGLWGGKSLHATANFQRDFGGISVDGIAGEETEKALKHAVAYGIEKKYDSTDCTEDYTNVQNNNTDDSTNNNTGTFWDEIKYFTREEFRCQCNGKYCNGFPVEPEEKMVRTVDEIRRRLGIPIGIVTSGGSGVRCPTHNAEVGGVYNSEHLYGRAADLHSSASPAKMKAVAEEVMGNTGGIGLYDWGIHVDTGKYSRWNG